MPKHLSIIVTHYKTPELLHLCLKSIKDTVKNIKYEIIVVSSESIKKNLGYSKIVNTGLKKVTHRAARREGDYILILNDDIIVLENAVSEMLKFMDKNPDVGIVGPQLIDFTNNIQASCFANPSLKSILARRTFLGKTKWGKKFLNHFTTGNVDWVQGSAMVVRKKALKKVGLLDERFFMYFEDADWCRRFWQKGYKVVYLPKARMAHYYHRHSKKWGPILDVFLNKYARTHIISALKYFWKYR